VGLEILSGKPPNPLFLVNYCLPASFPQAKITLRNRCFSPVFGYLKGRIRGLATPNISPSKEVAVVRA
jgi:hypothetical protein